MDDIYSSVNLLDNQIANKFLDVNNSLLLTGFDYYQ